MNTRLITSIVALALGTPVHAQTEGPTQQIVRAKEPRTGSHIKPIAALAAYPLDRPYEEFTADERKVIKNNWQSIAEADEPPFPKYGMRLLLQDISEATTKRQAEGMLVLVANVDAEGKVTRVEVYESPDDPLTRYVAAKLIRTPFKPAVCSGSPCSMQFPIKFKLTLRP